MSITIGSELLYNQTLASSKSSTLDNTLSKNHNQATDKELMDVCKEFEAYFLEQIFKNMEKTIVKGEEESNEYLKYFKDMQYEQYAKDASQNGSVGLAQILYESMKRV